MTEFSGFDRRQFLGALSLGAAALALPHLVDAQPAKKRLAGVFPIGFTPVNARNEVDFDGLAAQVQFCRRGGVHGLAWPQIASGWTTLTETERMKGAETILSAARGGHDGDRDRRAESHGGLQGNRALCQPGGEAGRRCHHLHSPSWHGGACRVAVLLSAAGEGDILAPVRADRRRLQRRPGGRDVQHHSHVSLRKG